jgi:hypothetical protein
MAEEEAKGPAHWWEGLRSKASHAVADRQAAFARGRVAGVTVTDDAGRTLVEAGQRIDDDILAQARQAGKIAALAASAMKAQAQDIKEKAQAQYARTEAGQEAQVLESVEDYREARRYLGRMLTLDVTDIRGNVVVASGKVLDDADLRRAREAGLLSALLAAAQRSLPAGPDGNVVSPLPSPASSPRRAPVLLAGPDDKEEEEGEGKGCN